MSKFLVPFASKARARKCLVSILTLLTLTSSVLFHAPAGWAQTPEVLTGTASRPGATSAVIVANAGSLGVIPDSNAGSPQCQNNSTNFRDVTFSVSSLDGVVESVAVRFNASHTFTQDLEVTLFAPTGQSLLLFSATGTTNTAPNSCAGTANDLSAANTYTFSDVGNQNWWSAANSGNPIPGGASRTVVTGIGGVPSGLPAITSLNAAFANAIPNGVWTLRFRDRGIGDVGTVTAADLSINTVPADNAVLDFDGDGKTDDIVTRATPPNIAWYIQRSSAGFTGVPWGTPGDGIVPADYDGDGKWDLAVFRSGFFYILESGTNTFRAVQFGAVSDDPRITQDYDGDGKADPAVTRNVGGSMVFYILRSTLGFTAVNFGIFASDVGIRGDFDGDKKADIAVYRNNNGSPANTYFIIRSSDGTLKSQQFGNFNSDYVVPADFDGDGRTDFAVWRGLGGNGNGAWYWLRSSDGVLAGTFFGIQNLDRPVVGDYDGDGKTDQAVFRPQTPGYFYHLGSSSGFTAAQFGQEGDTATGFSLQAR